MIPRMTESPAFDSPFPCGRQTVLPGWVDYNGHMNVAYYVMAFDHAMDVVLERLAVGPSYIRARNCSFFVLEAHICYLQEMRLGDELDILFQLIGFDTKRVHYMLTMRHAASGRIAATSEQVMVHVAMAERRSTAIPGDVAARLQMVAGAHAALPRPPQLGRTIGLGR